MSTDEKTLNVNDAPRYTVQMGHYLSPDHDINGVCRMVRDSLERGIIPVISIDSPEGK